NGVKPTPVSLELVGASREAAEGFQDLAEARGGRIVVVGEPLRAQIEPAAFRQILFHLLDNAGKYGPPGQTVTVAITKGELGARVSGDDQGPGVPDRDRERIFQSFVRLDRDIDRGTPGTGLGLSLVEEVVKAYRGSCWVEASPTGGARFV